MGVEVRLVSPNDAATVAWLLTVNREFLAPWVPVRPDEYFTEQQQRATLSKALARHEEGTDLPLMILDDGEVVGQVNVLDIVRGAFQSAHLGYWVSQTSNGRGVATAAVSRSVELAFGELGLHRLQADTLEHNVASRKVLARNGFVPIGRAPGYLRIAGRWQDHLLHQLLNQDEAAEPPAPT